MPTTFDFDLPENLIAQAPPQRRGDSRLLLVEPQRGVGSEIGFRQLPSILRPGDRLVLNDSRVLPARLLTRRADTGGQVEILLLRPTTAADLKGGWWCLARPARRLRPGVRLIPQAPPEGPAGDPPPLVVMRKDDARDEGQLVVGCDCDLAAVADSWGVMPLPPYIKRPTANAAQDAQDRDRYQTVYATADASGAGSVAAPMHFSTRTLAQLRTAGVAISRVSLHVGPGTFKPPSADQIAARRLHREYFHLPAQVSAELAATRTVAGRVIAVGTTALRVLETVQRLGLTDDGPDVRSFDVTAETPDPVFTGMAQRRDGAWEVSGQTRLFISPPDCIGAVDGLLTNFHLPGSSLLRLVAAFIGDSCWRDVYRHAVQARLRFYSYGDCMLILPQVGQALPDKDKT